MYSIKELNEIILNKNLPEVNKISLKLYCDYYENYILILNRLNDDMDSKKREENNFFDHRVFKDMNDNDKRKEVTDYIEKMFEEK